MKVVLPKINFTEVLRAMSVTYTAVLPITEATVEFVAGLLETQRQHRGTRWRKLTCLDQAVLALRWFLDGTRIKQLACDNDIGKTTAYDYLHETIDVLAERAPDLRNALLAAKTAGHERIDVDGTLIYTDRIREPGPTTGKNGKPVDLWWSGKHHHHGGNVQVVTAPDGWPLWTSDVTPGRTHDVTALRTHPAIVPALETWTGENLPVLGDLGYEGEAGLITVATKKPADGELTDEQKTANKAHNSTRAIGERGNSLLKTTFKALRRISLCPYRIGAIITAALVLLHIEHGRTT
jgi:hypothetical protein